jgi:phage shock protein C
MVDPLCLRVVCGQPQGSPGGRPDPEAAPIQHTHPMTNYPDRPAKRLTLSVTDKKIAGVCGGIAEYFSIDPTLVRVITVVLVLFFGGGLLAYLLAWIIMPKP